MQLKELTNQEFNNFMTNCPVKSIYQTAEYGMVMGNQGFKPLLLGLLKDGIVIAATLVLVNKEEGFKYAYAPRGFILNYEDFYLLKDFTNYIRNYLGKMGVMGIKINPPIVKNIYDFSNLNLINDVYLIIIDESGNEIERKNLKIQFDLSLTIISDYYGELQLIQNQDGEFIINSNLNDRVAFNSELEIMILETNSNEFYINENYQEFNITIIYEFITITSKIYAYGSFMEINMYLPYIEYQEENYIDSICFELNGFAILKSYTNEIQNIIDSFNYINYGNSIVFDYELDSSYILVSVEIMDNFYAYGIILIQQI